MFEFMIDFFKSSDNIQDNLGGHAHKKVSYFQRKGGGREIYL